MCLYFGSVNGFCGGGVFFCHCIFAKDKSFHHVADSVDFLIFVAAVR